MRTKEYTVVGLSGLDTEFALAQDTEAGTPLTLEAAAADIDPPRKLAFTTDGDMTDVTVTIVGTDRAGIEITETLVLPDTFAVLSTKVYASVTSITPDTTNVNNVSVGTTEEVPSPWVMCGLRTGRDQLSNARVSVIAVDGTVTGNLEITYSYPNDTDGGEDLTVDQVIAITPGTPVSAQGVMCRFVNTAQGTTARFRVARPGF